MMDREAFLRDIDGYRQAGFRLVQITASPLKPAPGLAENSCALIWTFEKHGRLEHLRAQVTPADEVPSVCGAYRFSYFYENEIRELFGLNITGLNVDFKGQLYQTATKVPFSPKAIRERLEAKGKKP